MINFKSIFIKVLISFIILISLSCDTTEPPNKGSLSLTLEEVSCTEAWLTLKVTDLPLPASLILKQNDQARTTINLAVTDTLLYLDSLLPKQNYSFQLTSIQSASGGQVSSNKANAATLDTTSHNFTWQTWTFGQHSSSVLYDVAIIDENNIWAVGEIYMNDSLGKPDPIAYNAVHWNGTEWKVKKISVLFRGYIITPPLEGVVAFSSTDIWFIGSLPIYGDGNNWTMFDLRTTVDPNLSLSRAWGNNSNNMYFVGRNGSIAHYNGSSWTKIESGTTTTINDIWGVNDLHTGERLILCAVSNLFDPGDYKILRINSSHKTDSISWGNGRRISSVWFKNMYKYFTSGGGIFISTAPDYLWKEQTQIPLIYTDRVRGTGLNDVFIVGDFGLVVHFNGYSWITIPEANVALNNSLDYKNNLMVSVGQRNQKGVILIGKKN